MRVVEAIISEVVYSRAIVVLDDEGAMINIEDIIEEDSRVDAQLEEIIEDIKE